jgi:hypothetical protein
VTATNSNDGTGSTTFSWTVNPVVTVVSPGNFANVPGDTVHVVVGASDAHGRPLTFSASNLPPSVSIDPATGVISGTITGSVLTVTGYTPVVTATDADNNTSSVAFTWTINPVVAVVSPGNQNNRVGDVVSLQVSASQAHNLPLTYNAVGLPTGLSIAPSTGLITGTVAAGADAGSPYTVQVSATDGTNSASQTFQWVIAP